MIDELANLLPEQKKELLSLLKSKLTDRRISLIETNLESRTNYLSLALEDIYQERNAGALIRTCDCMGIQTMHIIEKEHNFKVSETIAKGAMKWVDAHVHLSSWACINELKSKGVRVVATSPAEGGYTPKTMPLDKPMALFFGTERDGLSNEVLEAADCTLKIPMTGFTESLNVTVSVGIILYELLNRFREEKVDYLLTDTAKENLRLHWYYNSVKKAESILASLI